MYLLMMEYGDGCDRESYNVFYSDMYVFDTYKEAEEYGDKLLNKWWKDEWEDKESFLFDDYETFEEMTTDMKANECGQYHIGKLKEKEEL